MGVVIVLMLGIGVLNVKLSLFVWIVVSWVWKVVLFGVVCVLVRCIDLLVSRLVSMLLDMLDVKIWLIVVLMSDIMVLICRFMCCGCVDFLSWIMVGLSGLSVVVVMFMLVVLVSVMILVFVLWVGDMCCIVIRLSVCVSGLLLK